MNGETGEHILVLDVPAATSTDDAASILNEPLSRGYYLTGIVPWPTVGARAFYRLRLKTEGAVAQTLEAKAVAFIRDNRELSLAKLWAGLKALRFERSERWIAAKREEIMRNERHVGV